jgi:acyl transferase domain-containing protein/thioesterase domain-containing protein
MSGAQGTEADVAIVGMAVRVPGASDYRAFWRNLQGGVESIRRYTDEELLAAGEDPELLRQPGYVRAGAPLEGMAHFDGEFFGFSPRDCAILDPQHRHFLECAWEALEDAGHPPEAFGGPIGVFAGCGMGSYFYFNLCSNPELVRNVGMFLLRHTGNDKDFLATRLAYLLDLHGPAVAVQTACSTSLVAVHLACASLLNGECDMALAGGVTIELPHHRGYLFRENEILSPDGHCHAFDHRAKGTVFGSGAGVVALRPLQAALRDGDHIHAVIRGSAVNNDGGRKAGYLAPSVDGQAAAVVEALALAGVDARSIGYVECHGTGTYLGDPIEVAALTSAFRQSTDQRGFCRIGSVKSNIGHLDTAAGVVGLAKTALALSHQQIPATLNFEAPNPTIDFAASPFQVAATLTPWPRGPEPRRAGVNSLGVGGTNAHLVLQEAPPRPPAAPSRAAYQLLCLSARNRAALDEGCDRLAAHLEQHPDLPLADVAYTLKVGRRSFTRRRVLACRNREEAITLLRQRPEGRVFTHGAAAAPPAVFFMLPGGGAQYPGMGRELYDGEPLFRDIVDRGLAALAPRMDEDLRAVLFPAAGQQEWARQRFQRPSVQLPAIFLVSYALGRLLMSRGVTPRGLIGHSLGENTAAALAEVLSFEEALGLVHLRGVLFDGVPAGGMLSVALPRAELLPRLGPDLDLACVNAPGLCVVSGAKQPLAALEAALAAEEISVQRIPIDIAAHSRLLDGILGGYGAHLRTLRLRPPRIPFVSNRTGTWITEAQATDPGYWVEHLRHTVSFAEGIDTLARDPAAVFVEVGPGKTLGALARHNPAVSAQNVISTVRHADEAVDDRAMLQALFGRLWALGAPLDSETLWPGETRRRVPLPTYAFQRQRTWIEPGKSQPLPSATAAAPLPPRLDDPERWFHAPVWRRLDAEAEPMGGNQSWLLFLDETGLGERLCARLRARGDRVITVQAGDAYYKVSDEEYWLSPGQGPEGYQALVRDVLASGKVPARIVHLWLLTTGETFRPGSSFLHRNLERGFYSLLFLAQALGGEDYPRPLHLDVLSRGMQQVAGEPILYPEQATVLGPCRVIPRELPGVTCKSLDLAAPSRAPRWSVDGVLGLARELTSLTASPDQGELDALIDELRLPPESGVCALRGDGRWVERHRQVEQPPGPSRLRRGGVYLITGGLGGIGLVIARMLAREYQARLVLIGRSALPPRPAWPGWVAERPADPTSARIRAVQQLEALGAEVLVAAADVADDDSLAAAVAAARARFGLINGVIHAAGVLDDALMAAKRQASAELVFGPKVYGTLALDRVMRDEPLDFMVLFSSTSAIIGPAGQVDYAAANAFLDHFARKARAEGRPVTALGWGVWAEVGMAASAARRLGVAGAEEAAPETPAASPLYTSKQVQPGRGGVLRARYRPREVWFLDEHRTAERQAVLPGTAYLELARAALREVGENASFEIEDLFFFRSLRVGDSDARELRVQLRPSDEGYQWELRSRLGDDGGWVLHAQAGLRIGARTARESIDPAAIEARCRRRTAEDRSGIRSPQEDHLNFGPRWRVLHQASYGAAEALGRLALDPALAGDLEVCRLHPGLMDIATGFALELAPGYHGGDLWVPISYGRVRVLGDLPARLWSWVRLAPRGSDPSFASFDVTLAGEDGRVVVEVEKLTMRRLEGGALVAERPPAPEEILIEGEGAAPRALSRAELAFQHGLRCGITPAEGVRAFKRVLEGSGPQVIVSSMDLRALAAQADALAVTEIESDQSAKFSRPKLESEYVAPRNDIEKTLVGLWESTLGVSQIGVKDSFFELGGHSLVAVRLFARIKKTYGVDYPISVLFEAPTVEACARLVAEAVGEAPPTTSGARLEPRRTRYTHLVPMHTESPDGQAGGKAPFFLVAGMFGNVLNLRHLAQLVGADRPFYGLQARGLYGDHQPHESFEDMARDYLAELRTIQPHGPYLVGGFSGGGITAYEIARQLRAQGEEVALLVLLDTPLPRDPPLTMQDRLVIHQQNLTRQGPRYALNWLRDKRAYHQLLAERERKRRQQEESAARSAPGGHDFHSQVIQSAFIRALERYALQPQPLDVALFRPRLRPAHQLGPGRAINEHRRFIHHDNGWTPFVRSVVVHEVPGDHDGMVLEPFVRTLAARLRESLDAAEQKARWRQRKADAVASAQEPATGPQDEPVEPVDVQAHVQG